ncbi:MAG TPA: hypothetical protein VI413_03505, partial [Paludibacter sp.]
MILRFKEGSEVQKAAVALYNARCDSHAIAVKIIEEATGCTVNKVSQLGMIFFSTQNYDWIPDICRFDDEFKEVPGYTLDNSVYNVFKINKKTSIAKNILIQFRAKVRVIDSVSLNKFGIYTSKDNSWWQWR